MPWVECHGTSDLRLCIIHEPFTRSTSTGPVAIGGTKDPRIPCVHPGIGHGILTFLPRGQREPGWIPLSSAGVESPGSRPIASPVALMLTTGEGTRNGRQGLVILKPLSDAFRKGVPFHRGTPAQMLPLSNANHSRDSGAIRIVSGAQRCDIRWQTSGRCDEVTQNSPGKTSPRSPDQRARWRIQVNYDTHKVYVMTIEQTIAQIKQEQRAYRAELEDLIERGEREHRTVMTEAETKRSQYLFGMLDDLKSKLELAERVWADEKAADAAMRETHPTDAAPQTGTRTLLVSPDTHFRTDERGHMRPDYDYSRSRPVQPAESPRPDASPKWIYREDGKTASLGTGQPFGEHPEVRDYMARTADRDRHVIGEFGDLGMMVRSLSTTGASAVVPQIWANRILDLARNKSCILQTNAEVIPMTAKTVNVARLTADPTAAFRAEGDPINASDPSFDSITLTARTISALVTGSLEFFQDSIGGEQVIMGALGNAIALEFDKNAMFGGLITGANDEGFNLPSPPSPKGLLKNLLDNASGNVLGYAANGTAITAATPWNEILDTVYQPKLYNFEPSAIIWNTKMAKKLAKTYDANYQPMSQPRDVAALRQFVSNQIPSYTRGTMVSIATDIVVGDFSEMLIGHRMGLEIRVLNEKYAETGTIGIVAVMRVDVQLAHPYAFSVYRALGGA